MKRHAAVERPIRFHLSVKGNKHVARRGYLLRQTSTGALLVLKSCRVSLLTVHLRMQNGASSISPNRAAIVQVKVAHPFLLTAPRRRSATRLVEWCASSFRSATTKACTKC